MSGSLRVVTPQPTGVDEHGFKLVRRAPPPMSHMSGAVPSTSLVAADRVLRRGDATPQRRAVIGDDGLVPTPAEIAELERRSAEYRRQQAMSEFGRLRWRCQQLAETLRALRPDAQLRVLPELDGEAGLATIEKEAAWLLTESGSLSYRIREAEEADRNRPFSREELLEREVAALRAEVDEMHRNGRRTVNPRPLAGG